MKQRAVISNNLLRFFTMIKQGFGALIRSPNLILFLALPILLFIYLGYFIFAYDVVLPDISGIAPNNYSALQTAFRLATNSQNYHSLYVTILVIGGLILVGGIVLASLKKLTATRALVLVIALGIMMRMGYGFFTDALMTRQHDVWSIRGYGHWGIIMHYYETGEILPPIMVGGEINMGYSYQLYHPKFHHITMALFMRFNELFMGDNTWVLYQANRILLIFTSVMAMLVGERILAEMNIRGYGKVVGLSLIAFHPMFYRLSAMTNNDNLSIFFMFLAVLFAIKWFKKPTILRSVILALSIGLAMATKLSGALIAIPIGCLMIARFGIDALNAFKTKTYKPLFLEIGLVVLFAMIVFPLGLYWPIYNAQNYQIPFSYVWEVANQALRVTNTDPIQRFVLFPFDQLAKSFYVVLSSNSPLGQDYNVYVTLLKSSMFGEFTFGDKGYAGLLLAGNSLIYLSFIAAMIVGIIFLIKRKKVEDISHLVFMSAVLVVLFGSYIIFNIDAPMTCTMDFRYLVPLLIPLSYFLAKFFDVLSPQSKGNNMPFNWTYLLVFAIGLWAISGMLFYLSVIQ